MEDLARAAAAVIPPEVLAQVPGCEDGRPPLEVRALAGGRNSNTLLRIDTGEGRFVWRRRRPPVDRPGSAAIAELAAHRLAAAAGLAPRIVAANPDGRWLLMEFVDAPFWAEDRLRDPASLERLAGRLAALHALPVPEGCAVFDAPAVARGHLEQLRGAGPAVVAEAGLLVDSVLSAAQCGAREARPALNHGDLMLSNLLGPAPMLIDWEYAQLTAPTWDLACLLSYYPMLEARFEPLLRACGLDPAIHRERLRADRECFTALNRLWELAQAHGAG